MNLQIHVLQFHEHPSNFRNDFQMLLLVKEGAIYPSQCSHFVLNLFTGGSVITGMPKSFCG